MTPLPYATPSSAIQDWTTEVSCYRTKKKKKIVGRELGF